MVLIEVRLHRRGQISTAGDLGEQLLKSKTRKMKTKEIGWAASYLIYRPISLLHIPNKPLDILALT
jgi:hypothetical protein